jgi:sporulation protein YqfC
MPGLPIAELAGDRRLLIEHHQGVSAYSRENICIKVKFGLLQVCGCGLELVRMTREQLVIRGRIDAVNLIRRE